MKMLFVRDESDLSGGEVRL